METHYDIKELERLLTDGKRDEAAKLLTDWLARDLSEEEKGELYLSAIMVYLDVMRRVNDGYNEALAGTLEMVQELIATQKLLLGKSKELALHEDIGEIYDKGQ